MNTEALGLTVIFVVIGLGMFSIGVPIRLGIIKNWWILAFNPIVPELIIYLYIPVSFSFFLMAIAFLLPELEDRKNLFWYTIIWIIISIIVSLFRPCFLLPKWLCWLEKNHGDILSLLREEARKLGGKEWSKRVETQEGLEDWVAEVRRKYGR